MTSPPIPPQAITALGEAIQAYEPEAAALIIKSPAALLQVLLEAGRRAVEAAAPHLEAAAREHVTAPWRNGRRNPHTIYAQLGTEPSDDDPFIGSLNTPKAAAEAIRAHNSSANLQAAIDRVTRTAAAASEKAVQVAVTAERERIAQVAEQRARDHPGCPHLPFIAGLLRQEGGGT